MLKNCSNCKGKHLPPFGSYCKQKMAVVEGFDRNDQKYLKFLEDEYSRRKMEDDRKSKEEGAGGGIQGRDVDRVLQSLDAITERVGKLEANQNPIPGVPTTASDLLSTPLTHALSKLTLEEDDKGRLLRPETYSQSEWKCKNRDHTKMDTIDLLYGWISVIDYLVTAKGDFRSYISHVKFASQMLHTRQFYDVGAIMYDRQIVDNFINGKSTNFNPDTVVSSLTFAPRIIPDNVELCHGASLTKGVRSFTGKQKQRRKQSGNSKPVKVDDVPSDFPPDICFFYNYRQCFDENCSRSHLCRKCHGRHRADGCKEKTK